MEVTQSDKILNSKFNFLPVRDQFATVLEHRLRTYTSLFRHDSAACANWM